MTKKNIDICFGVDSNYAPYMAATITSLLKNEEEKYYLNFHVITSDITDDDKSKIDKLKEIRDFNINYYYLDDEAVEKYSKWFKNIKIEFHFRPSIFFRLSIPSMLSHIDKVLYTDVDVIFNKGIGHLFDEPMDDNYIFVLQGHKEFIEKIEDTQTSNIAAGFLFINNKLWIENNVEKEFTEYAESVNTLPMGDAEIINHVFSNKKFKRISHLFNLFSHSSRFTKEQLPNLDEIISLHYLTSWKPWSKDAYGVHFIEEFWKYFSLTEFFKQDIYKYIDIIIEQRLNRESCKINNRIDKVINVFARCIPVRKWRDKFRDMLK